MGMFRKRERKVFPAGTFIPKPARIMAILQLCLAFTVILSIGSYPFVGELFAHKSDLLLYHTVMGNAKLAGNSDNARAQQYKELLNRNSARFEQLPELQKALIIQRHNALQAKSESTFLNKLGRSLHIFFFELTVLEWLWIILSIVIPLLVLLKIEGAVQASWLLPLVAVLYGFTNYFYAPSKSLSAADQLFPTEQVIVQNYLKHPLGDTIAEQHDQLLHGWHLYLIKEWAHQEPLVDPILFIAQAETGEYAFDVARLNALIEQGGSKKTDFNKREPLSLLILYILWNVLVAWMINRYRFRMNTHPHQAKNS